VGFNEEERRESSAANGRHVIQPRDGSPPTASIATTQSARPWSRLPNPRLLIRVPFAPGMRRARADLRQRKRPPRRFGSFEELERELNRSRRYGHPLFLARISCRGDGAAVPDRTQDTASALGSILRSVDRTWTEGTDVYVLLPECDRAQGLAALARIREPLSQLLSAEEQDSISFAAWPDDCLTGGALFYALLRRDGPFADLATIQSSDHEQGTR
jgi:hypothetical protein